MLVSFKDKCPISSASYGISTSPIVPASWCTAPDTKWPRSGLLGSKATQMETLSTARGLHTEATMALRASCASECTRPLTWVAFGWEVHQKNKRWLSSSTRCAIRERLTPHFSIGVHTGPCVDTTHLNTPPKRRGSTAPQTRRGGKEQYPSKEGQRTAPHKGQSTKHSFEGPPLWRGQRPQLPKRAVISEHMPVATWYNSDDWRGEERIRLVNRYTEKTPLMQST